VVLQWCYSGVTVVRTHTYTHTWRNGRADCDGERRGDEKRERLRVAKTHHFLLGPYFRQGGQADDVLLLDGARHLVIQRLRKEEIGCISSILRACFVGALWMLHKCFVCVCIIIALVTICLQAAHTITSTHTHTYTIVPSPSGPGHQAGRGRA
jgi:hypothetical protein